jgi:hypothetical protein
MASAKVMILSAVDTMSSNSDPKPGSDFALNLPLAKKRIF